MEIDMDPCEFPNCGLDSASGNDLGLTLSPGSQQQQLSETLLEPGHLANPFDPILDLNFDLDLDFSALGNVDWALDGFQLEKKRPSDEAFPDDSSLATSKKQHVDAQQAQFSSSLFNTDQPNMSLLCQTLSFDGAFVDTVDTTSVASAAALSSTTAQNMPSVITFEKMPQSGAVKTNMSFAVDAGNKADNQAGSQAALPSHVASSRVRPSPASKQRAKRNMSVDHETGNKASVPAHMGPVRIPPGKQTVKTNMPIGVETANKASISSHVGSIRTNPARASGVAKKKFQVQHQDLNTNAAREALTRVSPRIERTSAYTKSGYVPSTPNQHTRVVQVGNDVMNTQLLQAKRQVAALIAERNKLKEFYDTYAAADPDKGIPKYKVMEKERATLRRLCTTQKRLNLQTKAECKEWEAKFTHLAGTFNNLLRDYHALLQVVTANADIQVPLPTTAYPVVPVAQAVPSAESSKPQGSRPASLPSLTTGSSANGNPTHVQQFAVPVPNTTINTPVQHANIPTNAVRPNRAQQLAASVPNTAAATSIPNVHAATNPVTPPTVSQEPMLQVLPTVEHDSQTQSALVIDLTDHSEKSPVSNPAINDGPQSLQSPRTSQAVTSVNAFAEFHRTVRKKHFDWLRQHDAADTKIALDLTKTTRDAHKNRSPKKDGIAPESESHHEMNVKEAYDFVQAQKAIRNGLGWPFEASASGEEEQPANDDDDEHHSENNSDDNNFNITAATTASDADAGLDLHSLFGSPGPADAPAIAIPPPPPPTVGPDGRYHMADEELARMLEAEMMREN